jgi:hypothetical protein
VQDANGFDCLLQNTVQYARINMEVIMMLVLDRKIDVCDNCNEPITAGTVKPCECRTCHVRTN